MAFSSTYRRQATRVCCLILTAWIFSFTTLFAHGVQIGYCVLSNGYIRVYIEHWHGDQTVQSLAGNSISVTTSYGSTTVTQNVDASGAVNNTSWNNLPGCGAGITILQGCSGEANENNDWGYFDFAPAACNIPVSITINAGNTVVFEEACSELYPQTINATFNDTAPPTLTCPSDVSVSACSAATATYSPASATDACDPNPTITYSQASGTTFSFGNNVVTVTATDADNNSSTCTFNVNVNDFTPPALSCPGNTTVNNDPGVCGNHFSYAVSANDNCDGVLTPSQTAGLTSGALFPIGTTTVSFSVSDGAGNNSTCSFNVTVNDNEAPQVIADNAYTVYLDANGNATLSFNDIDNGSSDNCSFTASLSKTSFNAGDLGNSPQNVTATLTDPSGNQSTHTVSVTIVDNLPPDAQCQDVTIILDANRQATTTAGAVDNGSTDNSGSVSLSLSQTTFDCDDEGPNTVTLTVTDGSGNSSTCTATVNVTNPNDVCNDPPVAACQDITVYTGVNCDASIVPADVDNGSSDPDGDPLIYSLNNAGPFGVGTYTVTLTVDDTEYTDNCTATVTVADNTNPIAVCQNIVAQLDANGNVNITPGDIDNGSSDACGIQSLNLSDTGFDCSDYGIQTVTLTATDVNGNSSTCTATVDVQDTVSPIVTCKNHTLNLGASGSGTISPADVFDSATDNCTAVNTVYVTPSSFDCTNVGANTVTLQVIDLHGNTSLCNAIVTVVDNTAPTVSCKNASASLDANGHASIDPADVFDAATDECTSVSLVSVSPASFDCNSTGNQSVTLTVADANGNTSTCAALVSITDGSAPSAVCQNATVILDGNGSASLTASQVDGGSSDACGIQSLSLSEGSFDCDDLGSETVTLTVTDVHGNSSTCTATVTVQDNTAPTASCQTSFTTDLGADGTYTLSPSSIDAGSSDNCGSGLTLSVSPSQFNCSDIGTNTVTLTATDAAGNTATCTASLTINPIVTIQGVTITHETCLGYGNGTIVINATTTSNCTLRYSIDGGLTFQYANWFGDLSPNTYDIVIELDCNSDCETTYQAVVNPGTAPSTWYKDLDGDGYTDGVTNVSCSAPAGYVASALPGDCDDSNPDFHPGQIWYKDADNDGFSDGTTSNTCACPPGYKLASDLQATSGDCDDNNAAVYPGATEVCNGIDDDCDGQIDEGASGNLVHMGSVVFTSQAAVDNFSPCYYKIQGNLIIQGFGINSLANLSNLQEVTGSVTIKITSLSDLSGLDNLTSIGGTLTISLNNYGAKLSSLNGLQNLTSIGSNLFIYFNWSLSDCCGIDDLLANAGVGGVTSIHHNASGCNSVADISNSCGGGSIIIPPSNGFPGIATSDASETQRINVYPNPAQNVLNVEVEKAFSNGFVRLIDMQGRTVYQLDLEQGMMYFSLPVDNLPIGMYQLVSNLDGEILTEKVMVKH